MKWLKILIVISCVSINVQAQMNRGLDTSIAGKIKRIMETKGYNTNPFAHARLKRKADRLLSKFDFLNDIIAVSYYSVGRPNEPLKNDLLAPSSKATEHMRSIFTDYPINTDYQLDNDLDKIDSILDYFYRSHVKNKYKNTIIKGDDDENMLVQVEVKVLGSYSDKKELAGFEVSCESPYAKNYREDFGVTTSAKRKISAGYRRFWIKKGPFSQSRLVRIVFGDPNTYVVTFSTGKLKQL